MLWACMLLYRDSRAMFGVFVWPTHKASVFVQDRVRTNQMPNMASLYQTERTTRMARYHDYPVPPAEFSFEIRVETELRRVSLKLFCEMSK